MVDEGLPQFQLCDVDRLKERVKSLPFEEITPGMKANLAIELTKGAVEKGEIEPKAARRFGQSMMDYCFSPIILGTSQNSIFPIEKVIQARPLIIERQRRVAEEEGINFEETIKIRREKAKATEEKLRGFLSEQKAIYGLFFGMMKPRKILEEISEKAKGEDIARQVLEGIPSVQVDGTKDRAAERFMSIDVPNYFFGRELVNWVDENYRIV
jgi:hypothetical protein